MEAMTQRAGRPASSTAFFMSRMNVGRRMRRPLASPISVTPLAGEALIAARNTLVEQSGTPRYSLPMSQNLHG